MLKKQDTAAALSQAIELRESAAIALCARRATLRAASDQKTLDALDAVLALQGMPFEHPERRAIRKEPHRRAGEIFGPEIEQQNRDAEAEAERKKAEELARVEQVSGPLPAFPCSRDTALRWSVSAPQEMRIVFIERECIKCLENWRETIARGALITWPESAADSFARLWPKDKMCSENDLWWLVHDLRPFWITNDCDGRYKAEKASAKELGKKKRAAGKEGATERTRKRWIGYTQNFRAHAGEREITPDLIKEFPKQKGVTLQKGREFLNTLLTAKDNIPLHSSLEYTLVKVKIKVPQSVAADCYAILLEGKIMEA